MKNKFGILQGRLTKAPSGRLQFFPNDWSKEFPIAKNIGFDYIELFSERTKNPKNPIWSLKQTKLLKKKYKDSNLIFYSFIDNYLIKSNIVSERGDLIMSGLEILIVVGIIYYIIKNSLN